MKRIAIILALLLSACEDSVTNVIVDPSPSPSPDVISGCTVVQTEIVARNSKGQRMYAWRYLDDISLEARFVFYGQQTPGFNTSVCPQLTNVTAWLLLPPGLCGHFGSIYTNQVYVSCLRPGTLDVTVTPTQGLQGRAIFDIRP